MAAIRYIVDDVDVAADFYARLLGFTVLRKYGPAMAILERDGLALWLAGPLASASRPLPDGRRPVPGGWNRMVLEVGDLPRLVSDLAEAGVTFLQGIVDGPGGRQTLCTDPAGNVVELFQAHSN